MRGAICERGLFCFFLHDEAARREEAAPPPADGAFAEDDEDEDEDEEVPPPAGNQLSSTAARTRLSYSARFSEKRRAASELAGELGFGSHSRLWMLVSSAATS